MSLGGNQLLKEQSRLNFMVGESMYDFLKTYLNGNKSSQETLEEGSIDTDEHWNYGSELFERSQAVHSLKPNGAINDRIEDIRPEGDFVIHLTPMQIRTFIIEVKRHSTN